MEMNLQSAYGLKDLKTFKTTVKLEMLPWGWVMETVMVFLGSEAINPFPVALVNSTRNCFASSEIILLFSNILIGNVFSVC